MNTLPAVYPFTGGSDSGNIVRMEKLPPDGFIAAPRDVLGFAAWLGPTDGRVTSTWTPAEGILVSLRDAEGLSMVEAEELAAQLHSVLEQLRNHQGPFPT